jgi:hypothetical protein
MAINLGNSINKQHPLNRGLFLWLLRTPNGSNGSQFVDLAGRYSGTLKSGSSSASANGRQGGSGSISFDGSSGYVDVPAKLFTDLVSYGAGVNVASVATWFYPKTSLSAYQSLFDAGTSAASRQLSIFLGGSSSQLYVAFASTAGNFAFLSTSLVLNTWQRLMATCDGTTITIYLNGVSVATVASATGTGFLDTASWRIGANPTTGGALFNGMQDDIRVWGRLLSANEAMQDYVTSITGYQGVLNRISNSFITTVSAPAGAFNPYYYRYISGGSSF